MKTKIETLKDLRLEINHLKHQYTEQEEILESHVKSFMDKLHKPMTLLHELDAWFAGGKHKEKDKEQQDWVSDIFHATLPLVMNTLFFRKSNIITKATASVFFQHVGDLLNKDSVMGIFTHVADWIKRLKGQKAQHSADRIPS